MGDTSFLYLPALARTPFLKRAAWVASHFFRFTYRTLTCKNLYEPERLERRSESLRACRHWVAPTPSLEPYEGAEELDVPTIELASNPVIRLNEIRRHRYYRLTPEQEIPASTLRKRLGQVRDEIGFIRRTLAQPS